MRLVAILVSLASLSLFYLYHSRDSSSLKALLDPISNIDFFNQSNPLSATEEIFHLFNASGAQWSDPLTLREHIFTSTEQMNYWYRSLQVSLNRSSRNSTLRKEFLYITQTESCMPEHLALMSSFRSDIVVISWQRRCNLSDHVFAPRTTWALGRNLALLYGLMLEQQLGWRYKYWIFLDDDTSLSLKIKNSTISPYRAFEDFLNKHEPAVGYPLFGYPRVQTMPEARTVGWFDALYNAFHRDVLLHILPYDARLDRTSCWWLTQAQVILRASIPYRGLVLMSNDIGAKNPKHRGYPRSCTMAAFNQVQKAAHHDLTDEVRRLGLNPAGRMMGIFHIASWGVYKLPGKKGRRFVRWAQ